jgi:hypothetical protein
MEFPLLDDLLIRETLSAAQRSAERTNKDHVQVLVIPAGVALEDIITGVLTIGKLGQAGANKTWEPIQIKLAQRGDRAKQFFTRLYKAVSGKGWRKKINYPDLYAAIDHLIHDRHVVFIEDPEWMDYTSYWFLFKRVQHGVYFLVTQDPEWYLKLPERARQLVL